MPFRGCCGPKEGESPPRAPAAVRRSPPAAPARPIFAWKRSQGCFVCSTLLSIKERDSSSFPQVPGRGHAADVTGKGPGCCWNQPHSTEHRDRAGPPGLPAPGKSRTGRDRTKRGILRLLSHPRDPHGTRRTGLLHPHLPKPADPSGCTQGPAEQCSAPLGNGSFQQGNKPNIPGRCSSISQHRAEPSYTERPGRKRVRRGDPLPREPVLRSLQPLQSPPGIAEAAAGSVSLWTPQTCPLLAGGHPGPTPQSRIWGCSRAPQDKPGQGSPSSGVPAAPAQGHLGRAAAPAREVGIICVEGDIYKKLTTKQELFSLPRDYGAERQREEERRIQRRCFASHQRPTSLLRGGRCRY